MAIRFFCKGCSQLLGIASRKAGTEIECPKCGLMQTVPTEEAAVTAMAMVRSGQADAKAGDPPLPELQVYDDAPEAIESSPAATVSAPPLASGDLAPSLPTASAPARASSAPSSTPALFAPSEVGEPVPPGTILFPRKTVYLQAVVFFLAGTLLFAAGYFIGRGDATVAVQVAAEAASKEQVLLEGELAYNPRPGEIHGDREAVVIAIPADARPEPRLSIDGLRPQDPPPAENQASVRRIRESGGNYVRADVSGHYSMILPDAGEYRFLVISANAARPDGEEIDEIDLQEMGRYFDLARNLINRFKYRWETRALAGGAATLDHNFGAGR